MSSTPPINHTNQLPMPFNAIQLSRAVIASAAKQSLLSAGLASSLAFLAMMDIEIIETTIRHHVPYVEHVLVHVEPARQEVRRFAVPLADRTGVVSAHFGTAPYFALVDRRTATGNHENQMILRNPYAADPRGRGLKVAQWLLQQRVDMLITADDIREKGPGFALGDAGVEIIISAAASLDAALTAGAAQQRPADQSAPICAEAHNAHDAQRDSRKV